MGESESRTFGVPNLARTLTGVARPLLSVALLAVGVALPVLAVATALWATPYMGVIAENPAGTVLRVEPGSFAWRVGIREGQTVLSLDSSDSPGGWQITVRGPDAEIHASARGAEAGMRERIPIAVLGVLLAVAGVASFVWRPRRAGASLSLAVVAAATALGVASEASVFITASVAALVVPVAWIAGRMISPRRQLAVLASGGLLAGAWLVARLAVPGLFDVVDAARAGVVVAAAVAVVGLEVDQRSLARRLRDLGGLRTLDVATIAVAVVVAVLLLVVAGAGPLVTVGVLAIGALLYPRWRGAAGAALDRLLIADWRRRLSAKASELERGRLARDLHDVPLQELAGVIRRLEFIPEAHRESAALREVADHLRAVATELRPPVLEDFGLVPAIEFLAAQVNRETDAFRVEATVADEVGGGSVARPPAEVEIALFRIVQEALSNAVRHSGGRRAFVRGKVGPGGVDLTVADDGRGLAPGAIDHAIREGRMGTVSLQERARSVGAALRFGTAREGGLSVHVEWAR